LAASQNSNGADAGLNTVLRIELDGNGLSISSAAYNSASMMRGLVIDNAPFGIRVNGGGYRVPCNFIGTDPSGTLAEGNLNQGILLTGSHDNVIGVDGDGVGDEAERNLISANRLVSAQGGVEVQGTGTIHNVIAGNLIGTDVTGTQALPNLGPGI